MTHLPLLQVVIFASITGAWIETYDPSAPPSSGDFASITGAWIETYFPILDNDNFVSRPSRARGLKRYEPHRQIN